ncbi:tetratricopeptide repeat protein [Hymenobacter puniceus]|uniref:tetratricopeptide repeat protein n=1 Tax=Hymenobacter sp. BT190 TaxID=2763505 RepID=UPI0016517817|nr:tetratricopeptide repeat protein [Hymenobacter sp. BT190]MBC6697684.1 tetratricopeptide repeat protein [Hymenobacter sp. BT190]
MKPDTPAARWQSAVQNLLDIHRPEQAEQLVRQQLARNPQDVFAHILLSFALYQQNQLERARETAQQALALNPAASEAFYVLFLVEDQAGQGPARAKALQEALRLQPLNPKYLAAQAQLYLHQTQPAAAQLAAARGLAQNPAHAGCLIALADALHELQRWPELAPVLQQLVAAHPNLPKAHQLLGREAMRQQQYAAAQVHYQEVLRLAPTDATALQGASQAIRRQLWIGRAAVWLDNYLTFISEGTKQGKLKAWGYFLLILIPLSLLCIPILLFMGFEAVYWRLHPQVRHLRNRPDQTLPYVQQTFWRYGPVVAFTLLLLAWLTAVFWLLVWLGVPESSLGPGLTGGLTTVAMAIWAAFKQASEQPLPAKSPLLRVLAAGLTLAVGIACVSWPATWPYGPLGVLGLTSWVGVLAFRRARAAAQ